MPQITPQNAPDDARELLERNVQKTVAISTLRKIRGLVDEYDEEERRKRALSRRVAITAAVVIVGLALALAWGGGALPRILTAVLALRN